ncbi:MAG: Bifunctional protein HldE [candidate division TM6 bacterium GW2011_GWF2_37_49]|nr:MAG: Bifunctional protein HldE [candidate division TM6 bacterium GW2011_GWF2_37_49]
MKEIINQLKLCKKKEVLVIGDVMVDEYVVGNVERISSEAPIPVVKEVSRDYCIGGAGNVAANCVEIGFKTTIISIINDSDFSGQKIISILKDAKIPMNGLVRSNDRKTTHKKRIVSKNQQLLCLDSEDVKPLSRSELKSACEKIDLLMKPGMLVLISDYDRGFITPEFVEYIIKRAAILKCLVMVDPSGPDYLKYKGAQYIKPNLKEFNEMLSVFNLNPNNDPIKNGVEVCKKLQCGGLFVTMGEKGIQYISPNLQVNSPTQATEIYGLAGAGDTVFAYLALCVSCNLSIDLSLIIANKAAAIAVLHVRTYSVSLDELINKEIDFSAKIFTEWSHLKIELDWQSFGKKNVIFASGCFDILHAGHVYLLKEAKKLGDILVVGINSDESVKMLGKGSGRPVNSFTNRANVIAALGMVDFVVQFDQSSPKELLEYLKPDVFVKGGDYIANKNTKNNELLKKFIEECDVVKKYGGLVKMVELVPNLSTTNIIKKINDAQV